MILGSPPLPPSTEKEIKEVDKKTLKPGDDKEISQLIDSEDIIHLQPNEQIKKHKTWGIYTGT